ncbi:MAG: thiol reductant ABC exporter subunit CydC [Proteobacteria bacterium]|nr:MAG: thiol reductant ABC exporter subunit CydC [Pseudomonadota bacterium]
MKVFARLLTPVRRYTAWLAFGLLAALATLVANVGLMAISGWFIAAMAVAGSSGAAINYFTPAAFIRAFAMLRTGGRYVERLVVHEATFRVLGELRVWFFEHLEPLAPARLSLSRDGDLLSRVRADIDSLENLYARLLVPTAVALLGIAATGAFMLRYDAALALVTLAGLMTAGFVVPYTGWRFGSRPAARQVGIAANLRTALVDSLQGMRELSVFGGQARSRRRVAELDTLWVAEQRRLSNLRGLTNAAIELASNVTLLGGLIVAVPLVGNGTLSGPELAMAALFILAAFESVSPLPQAFTLLGETTASAQRLFEVVDSKPMVTDPCSPPLRVHGLDIELESVGFRYRAGGDRALDGVTFAIHEGERVAIIGPSGSGKSSIVNLLLRFWDYQEGSIRLGGRELRDYCADDVRSQFSVVSQYDHLFNTTIRENLLVAAPRAGRDALERACRNARIHDAITAMPAGYDTLVGEGGAQLSGGESRRLIVARALLRNAPLLVLDEPTEGLDSATAASLTSTLDKLMRGRTVILITHRACDLQCVDRIVMLEHGTVTDTGTHDELLKRNEGYAGLFDSLDIAAPA